DLFIFRTDPDDLRKLRIQERLSANDVRHIDRIDISCQQFQIFTDLFRSKMFSLPKIRNAFCTSFTPQITERRNIYIRKRNDRFRRRIQHDLYFFPERPPDPALPVEPENPDPVVISE